MFYDNANYGISLDSGDAIQVINNIGYNRHFQYLL
jgi:hypothetical protein